MISLGALQEKLGQELVNSPFLAVMIVNRKYQVVWHNQKFADDFNQGQPIADKSPCFQAGGFGQVHADCPLQESIRTGKSNMACIDAGESNFFYMCIPLDEEHAAKVHIFLPKATEK